MCQTLLPKPVERCCTRRCRRKSFSRPMREVNCWSVAAAPWAYARTHLAAPHAAQTHNPPVLRRSTQLPRQSNAEVYCCVPYTRYTWYHDPCFCSPLPYAFALFLLAASLSRAFDLAVAATAVGKCATAVPVLRMLLRMPSPPLFPDTTLSTPRRQGTPSSCLRLDPQPPNIGLPLWSPLGLALLSPKTGLPIFPPLARAENPPPGERF